MPLALILCLGLIALPFAAPAAAQTRQEQWDRCTGQAGKTKDEQIASCTAIIAAGNEIPVDLSSAYRNRGGIYFSLARYGEALADYDKALSIGSVSAERLVLRGDAHFWLGHDDLARADYDKALVLEPENADALTGLASLSVRQKDYAAAADGYGRVIAVKGSAENYYARANMYFNLHRYDEALADYDKALWIGPVSAERLVQRGDAHYGLNQDALARADYEQALRLEPQNLGALTALGHVSWRQKDYVTAVDAYDRLIATNSSDAQLFVGRGDAYFDLHLFGAAIADLDKALSIGPVSADWIVTRGYAHHSLGQEVLARADFDEALRLDPQNVGALTGLGEVSLRQKDYAAGLAYYDRALAISPRADIKKTAGWNRAVLGADLDRARTLCDEALRESPDNADYHDCRGMVGLKQHRYQDAWNDFDAAARANTSFAFIPLYGRGIAERELGRAAESQADIARAKALNARSAEIYAAWGIAP
jgi:tetratricopeptide (TPR) repeat protein